MIKCIVGESMNSNVFVSKAFTHMITEYLNCKENKNSVKYNSFFVVVLRLLIQIYDELDIINPYKFQKEQLLYDNMSKYGYSQNSIEDFFILLDNYYNFENSVDFIQIQKYLVNMFIMKRVQLDLTDKEINDFRKLLYSNESGSPFQVSYNFKMTNKPNEILEYFDYMLDNNHKKVVEKEKETLNMEAYKLLQYSLEDIQTMDADELDNVNKQIYNYFDINANAINKDYLLDKKIYDLNHPTPNYSTGNGYVDILFILAIVATLAMVILIIMLFVV